MCVDKGSQIASLYVVWADNRSRPPQIPCLEKLSGQRSYTKSILDLLQIIGRDVSIKIPQSIAGEYLEIQVVCLCHFSPTRDQRSCNLNYLFMQTDAGPAFEQTQ
jgi:hypothetical protein